MKMETNMPKIKTKQTVVIASAITLAAVVMGSILYITRKQEEEPAQNIVATATIMINEDGFAPADIKIKRGTVVIWNNQDPSPHRIVSGPYPSHSNLEALDSKTNIDTNSSYRFTFDKAGAFPYFDELNPKHTGTITVE